LEGAFCIKLLGGFSLLFFREWVGGVNEYY
jgi:hypothetical protein